ncbi:long chain base biosynthesis protein 1 [Tanacetum coccineum]
MESLRSTLEKVTQDNKRAKKLRRYIVVESVYQNSGQIAPLDEIIRLKEKYRFRVLLDESNSFGVLGESGRGLTEHYKVPIDKVDIITAAMGHALASEGGFCTGSNRVIDHQRLSSSGYVFSACLPPYLACVAITAIDVIDTTPQLLVKLRDNVKTLWTDNVVLRRGKLIDEQETAIKRFSKNIKTSSYGIQEHQGIDQLSMILSTISDASRLRTSGNILSDMGIVKTKHGYFLLFFSSVIIERTILYGLAAKGEYGVRSVIEILKDELELTMALSGCSTLNDITRNHVRMHNDDLHCRL